MAINRNDPCPCGSGRKFKKCCMGKHAAGRSTGPSADRPEPDLDDMVRHAVSHRLAGRFEQAERVCREILVREPHHVDGRAELARLLETLGRTTDAIDMVRPLIDDRSSAEILVLYASLLQKLHQSAEAHEIARRAVRRSPDHPMAHHLVAVALERSNRLDEALVEANRATELDPDLHMAATLKALILRRLKRLDEARGVLDELASHVNDPESAFRVHKELGLVLDLIGEHDAAFDEITTGNQARASCAAARHIDRDLIFRTIEHYTTHLTPALLSDRQIPAGCEGDPQPVFLVGFPRSGTTMTEQILAAHPDVATTDEAPLLRDVVREITGAGDEVNDLVPTLASLSTTQIHDLRQRYWTAAAQLVGDDLSGRTFLDKVPLNLVHLGFINVVFPEARILVALRDPRDVCLSCYTQRFGLNAAMVHFLDWRSTARLYASVMSFWTTMRDLITVPWIEVRYEDTVTDLPGQARRILDHLDLDWHDDLLRFHEIARTRLISTPSYAAVTEPIHARAVGRWRAHEHRFAEIAEILDPMCSALGYD